MTLSNCLSFQKLAGTEINLEGEKGDFYSKVKNTSWSWLFFGGVTSAPSLLHKTFLVVVVKQTCLYIYQLSNLVLGQKM